MQGGPAGIQTAAQAEGSAAQAQRAQPRSARAGAQDVEGKVALIPVVSEAVGCRQGGEFRSTRSSSGSEGRPPQAQERPASQQRPMLPGTSAEVVGHVASRRLQRQPAAKRCQPTAVQAQLVCIHLVGASQQLVCGQRAIPAAISPCQAARHRQAVRRDRGRPRQVRRPARHAGQGLGTQHGAPPAGMGIGSSGLATTSSQKSAQRITARTRPSGSCRRFSEQQVRNKQQEGSLNRRSSVPAMPANKQQQGL